MTVTVPSYNPILLEGLSTDTKPDTWEAPGNTTQSTPPRSTFLETDTGDEYYYTGETWLQVRESGVKTVEAALPEITDATPLQVYQDASIFDEIKDELKIMNFHLSLITEVKVTAEDTE